MRVLVTGANGFVGRAVVDALSRSGVAVMAAVRHDADFAPGVRICRIGDIGPATDWPDAVGGCDAVVHLAARVHVMRDLAAESLAAYREVNVAGTLRLAQLAAARGARRFLFVSSVKVHGEGTRPGSPYRETDAPTPADPYGVSKLEAERALFALVASTGMQVVVVRPPLVYGPGVRANFLAMVRWLARGIPLPLGAISDNRRSLVGLDNLVDLITTALHHPSAANEVFLVSDGADLSTTELLRHTAEAMGVSARLVPVPVAVITACCAVIGKAAVAQRLCGNLQVDIGKAERMLGWRPPVSVDEGLRRAVHALGVRRT